MNMDSSPKLLLSHTFTSFEELAAMVVAWDIDFRQLSKNYTDTTVEQIRTGNILFTHLACGCYATHAGATPKNMYTIGLPDPGCPVFRYDDQLIDQPALLVATPGKELNINTRPGYGITTFSIPKSVLETYCERHFGLLLDELLAFQNKIIPISKEMAVNLRASSLELSRITRSLSKSSGELHFIQSFESQLVENLFSSFLQKEQPNKEPGMSARSRMLKRAQDFIKDHELDSLNVRDLAAAVNTSERTLERVFNRELGIAPKKYLLGERMYGVHRHLWQSSPSEISVNEIANAWGFWHMGQFAKDYRSLFGELPSETLNRSGATRKS